MMAWAVMLTYAIDSRGKPPQARSASDNNGKDNSDLEGAVSPGPESEDDESTFISPVMPMTSKMLSC